MDTSVKLDIELKIIKGRGYVPAEENKTANSPFGTIFIDSIFTPIKNVKYTVENFRVEQKTDYEKLIFDIVTDGSIHPKDALQEAAKIDRKSTRLNSSHVRISYAVFCLKKKKKNKNKK